MHCFTLRDTSWRAAADASVRHAVTTDACPCTATFPPTPTTARTSADCSDVCSLYETLCNVPARSAVALAVHAAALPAALREPDNARQMLLTVWAAYRAWNSASSNAAASTATAAS